MDTATLGLNVDASKVVEATEAFNDLAKAAARAQQALVQLGIQLVLVGADDEDDEQPV